MKRIFVVSMIILLAGAVSAQAADQCRIELNNVKEVDLKFGNPEQIIKVTAHYGVVFENTNLELLQEAKKRFLSPEFLQSNIKDYSPAQWLGVRFVRIVSHRIQIEGANYFYWSGQIEIRGTWGEDEKEWTFIIESR